MSKRKAYIRYASSVLRKTLLYWKGYSDQKYRLRSIYQMILEKSRHAKTYHVFKALQSHFESKQSLREQRLRQFKLRKTKVLLDYWVTFTDKKYEHR